ncbi:hypothetical protein TPL01_10110 [Sulfuriferula plumbiphila]|uniref:Uncharacterized protein n=1 Tax=Sulfuriferula plumbiphila TaxID=171865 RepID=A0A512L5W9_9PROT|nr:hypothetical protein [Sulfuriferula plumbiphila]BBP05127.1 hypothetical protein SFPGR_25490 [Sulfuriferula plumbiphila]GEP29873.1 hypothetical protein TPL01_10110 [Sulfuriferula plumbiphila]
MADSTSPLEGCTSTIADAGQVNHPTTGENAPAALCGACLEVWRGSFMAMQGGVCEPSFVDVIGKNRQR